MNTSSDNDSSWHESSHISTISVLWISYASCFCYILQTDTRTTLDDGPLLKASLKLPASWIDSHGLSCASGDSRRAWSLCRISRRSGDVQQAIPWRRAPQFRNRNLPRQRGGCCWQNRRWRRRRERGRQRWLWYGGGRQRFGWRRWLIDRWWQERWWWWIGTGGFGENRCLSEPRIDSEAELEGRGY